MRLLYFYCLLIILAGCQAQEDKTETSVNDSLRQEQQLLAQRSEELERENRELRERQERREAEEKARRAEESRMFPAEAVLGSWKVRLNCTESDCERNSKVGDVFSQDWTIDYVGGQHVITVTNNLRNTNKEYYGSFDGKDLQAHYEAQSTGWTTETTAKVSLNLRMKDENTLVGTRKVVNKDPCSITYDVEAVRD